MTAPSAAAILLAILLGMAPPATAQFGNLPFFGQPQQPPQQPAPPPPPSGQPGSPPTALATGQNQLLGTGIGGILGGIAGSFFGKDGAVGTVLGALVGAVVGNQLGALLDQREKEGLANASQRAAVAPAGEKVTWSTPDDRGKKTASGWAMPVGEPETAADGKSCRKVRQSVDKAGKTVTEDVTLCREESAWVMPAP